MLTKEKRRLATQLNLDPNTWVMVEATGRYIRYRNAVTSETKKFYYGGECR